jgi:acyl-CoA thioesterase
MMVSVKHSRTPSQEALAEIHRSFMTSPFNRLVGIEFGGYHEDGVTLCLPVGMQHQNGAGVVHGGVMLTLADAALGFGIARTVGNRCTTAELKINYLRPVTKGVLEARSRILRAGRKLVVARAEVRCGEKHVAEVLTTFAVLD